MSDRNSEDTTFAMGKEAKLSQKDSISTPQQPEASRSSETLPEYDASQQSEIIRDATRPTDDGRIDIDLNSQLGRTLARLVEIPSDDSSYGPPPTYAEVQPWSSRLNIVVQVVGSRGDVQPFIALGTELQRQGHRVRLATHDTFKDFVQSSGLEFYPVGGDPTELMAYMVKNPGLIPNLKTLKKGEIQKKRKMIAQMLEGFWRSCILPDPDTKRPFVAHAIIANPPSFAGIHCAQALGCPLHLIFTMPWSPTRAFPHPLANLKYTTTEPKRANYLSYILVQVLTWQGLADVINKFRKSIDLEDVPLTEAPMLAETLLVPYTYCWSPALVPKPRDWGEHIDVCGFLFRDAPAYTPPEDLDAFLKAGPVPVYIGFGSIVIDDPAEMTKMLVDAVRACGVRAIISKGWSKLGQDVVEEGIFFLGDCPHEWLFQHVSAVVHHGGAGTTACGLANARPTFIVPFFGDQPFWGNMVAAAGAGPVPIPYKELTTDNITEAIKSCLMEEALTAAKGMAEKMQSENGVKTAVDSFHRNLSSDVMCCDVLPQFPAVWACIKAKRPFKLCGIAAQTLLEAGLIRQKDLAPYESKTTIIQNRRWDVVTSGSAVQLEITLDVINALNHIWRAPRDIYRESAKSKSEDGDKTAGKVAGQMALSSAMFVPKVLGAFTKGMLVDAPLATTEGLRNMSALYGDKMNDHRIIVDWKTGAIVAGEEMMTTYRKGLTDIFTMPYQGAKKDGAWGFTKGVAMGVSSSLLKTSAGMLGLVAYPAHGIYKSIYTSIHSATRKTIASARKSEDEWNFANKRNEYDRLAIIDRFGEMVNVARSTRSSWLGKRKSGSTSGSRSVTADEAASDTASEMTGVSSAITMATAISIAGTRSSDHPAIESPFAETWSQQQRDSMVSDVLAEQMSLSETETTDSSGFRTPPVADGFTAQNAITASPSVTPAATTAGSVDLPHREPLFHTTQ